MHLSLHFMTVTQLQDRIKFKNYMELRKFVEHDIICLPVVKVSQRSNFVTAIHDSLIKVLTLLTTRVTSSCTQLEDMIKIFFDHVGNVIGNNALKYSCQLWLSSLFSSIWKLFSAFSQVRLKGRICDRRGRRIVRNGEAMNRLWEDCPAKGRSSTSVSVPVSSCARNVQYDVRESIFDLRQKSASSRRWCFGRECHDGQNCTAILQEIVYVNRVSFVKRLVSLLRCLWHTLRVPRVRTMSCSFDV